MAHDQQAFDAALHVVMQDTTDRLNESLRHAPGTAGRRTSIPSSDAPTSAPAPPTRRPGQHTRDTFPQLTSDWESASSEELAALPAPAPTEPDDDVSLGSFESEIEQTSDTLEILERIATIEEQPPRAPA